MLSHDTLDKLVSLAAARQYQEAIALLEGCVEPSEDVEGETEKGPSAKTLLATLSQISSQDETDGTTKLWSLCAEAYEAINCFEDSALCFLRSVIDDTTAQSYESMFNMLSRMSIPDRQALLTFFRDAATRGHPTAHIGYLASEWAAMLSLFIFRNPEAALSDIERVLATDDKGPLRTLLAQHKHLLTGDHESAVKAAEVLIQAAPHMPAGYVMKVDGLLLARDEEAIAATLKEAVRSVTSDAEALLISFFVTNFLLENDECLQWLNSHLGQLRCRKDHKARVAQLLEMRLKEGQQSSEYISKCLPTLASLMPSDEWARKLEDVFQRQVTLLNSWDRHDYSGPEGIAAIEPGQDLLLYTPGAEILEDALWTGAGVYKRKRLREPFDALSHWGVVEAYIMRLGRGADHVVMLLCDDEPEEAADVSRFYMQQLEADKGIIVEMKDCLASRATAQSLREFNLDLARLWSDGKCSGRSGSGCANLAYWILTEVFRIQFVCQWARKVRPELTQVEDVVPLDIDTLRKLRELIYPQLSVGDQADVTLKYCCAMMTRLRNADQKVLLLEWKGIVSLLEDTARTYYKLGEGWRDKSHSTSVTRLGFHLRTATQLFERHPEIYTSHLSKLAIEYSGLLAALNRDPKFVQLSVTVMQRLATIYALTGMHEECKHLLIEALSVVESNVANAPDGTMVHAIRGGMALLYGSLLDSCGATSDGPILLTAFGLCQNLSLMLRRIASCPDERGTQQQFLSMIEDFGALSEGDTVDAEDTETQLERLKLPPLAFLPTAPEVADELARWGRRTGRRVGVLLYQVNPVGMHIALYNLVENTLAHTTSHSSCVFNLLDEFNASVSQCIREHEHNAEQARTHAQRTDNLLSMIAPELLPPGTLTDVLEGLDTLVVVPHDRLHAFPFHWLPYQGKRLFTAMTVLQNPSLLLVRPNSTRKSISPASSFQLFHGPDALGADAHYERLSRVFKNVEPVPGESDFTGNAQRFFDLHGRTDCVVLHCHFYSEGRAPMDSYFLLGGRQREGGGVDHAEPVRLRSIEGQCAFENTQLVVLCCCHAHASSWEHSELLGGAHAMLSKGAATVLSPLYPVVPEAAAQFMGQFYEALAASGEKHQAYSTATRKTAAAFADHTLYGHPIFSAPWMLAGHP